MLIELMTSESSRSLVALQERAYQSERTVFPTQEQLPRESYETGQLAAESGRVGLQTRMIRNYSPQIQICRIQVIGQKL